MYRFMLLFGLFLGLGPSCVCIGGLTKGKAAHATPKSEQHHGIVSAVWALLANSTSPGLLLTRTMCDSNPRRPGADALLNWPGV